MCACRHVCVYVRSPVTDPILVNHCCSMQTPPSHGRPLGRLTQLALSYSPELFRVTFKLRALKPFKPNLAKRPDLLILFSVLKKSNKKEKTKSQTQFSSV